MKPRYLLATIILLLVGLTLVWLRRPAEFKRYVSPPLSDGTRYTFLYPARMTQIVPRSDIGKQTPPVPMTVGGVDIDDSGAVAPSKLQTWLDGLLRRAPPYEVSTVGVLVTKYFDAFAEPRVDNSVMASGSSAAHVVLLFDKRTRQTFQMMCSSYRARREQSEQETKIIAESFRVLRPGEAVP